MMGHANVMFLPWDPGPHAKRFAPKSEPQSASSVTSQPDAAARLAAEMTSLDSTLPAASASAVSTATAPTTEVRCEAVKPMADAFTMKRVVATLLTLAGQRWPRESRELALADGHVTTKTGDAKSLFPISTPLDVAPSQFGSDTSRSGTTTSAGASAGRTAGTLTSALSAIRLTERTRESRGRSGRKSVATVACVMADEAAAREASTAPTSDAVVRPRDAERAAMRVPESSSSSSSPDAARAAYDAEPQPADSFTGE